MSGQIALRTKNVLMDSFLSLLSKSMFQKITVGQLLGQSHVSKGTFYKYYADKYELAKESFERFYQRYQETFLCSKQDISYEEQANFFRWHREEYLSLMTIKNNELDFRKEFTKRLKEDIHQMDPRLDDMGIDSLSNRLIWQSDYLTALSRDITSEDVASSSPMKKEKEPVVYEAVIPDISDYSFRMMYKY